MPTYQVNMLKWRLTVALLKSGDGNFLLLFSNFLISPLSLSFTVVLLLFPLLFPARLPIRPALPRHTAEGRFQLLANNNLQIHQVTKADEGVYRCEASVEARGEIDFVDIAVVVNGGLHVASLLGI